MKRAMVFGITTLAILFVFAVTHDCYAGADKYRYIELNKVANQGAPGFKKPEVSLKTPNLKTNADRQVKPAAPTVQNAGAPRQPANNGSEGGGGVERPTQQKVYLFPLPPKYWNPIYDWMRAFTGG